MDGLQQWAFSICASVLIAGVFSILAPKGSMEKLLRLVVSVFLIMALFSPFIKSGKLTLPSFSEQDAAGQYEDAKDLEQAINEQMAKQMEASIKGQITACLKKNGADGAKVRVSMDIDSDGRIKMNEIMILISDSDRAKRQEIRQAVKNELGLNVTVLLESEV